jgi:hypothetical protein
MLAFIVILLGSRTRHRESWYKYSQPSYSNSNNASFGLLVNGKIQLFDLAFIIASYICGICTSVEKFVIKIL